MALQASVTVRNAILDAIETAIGTQPFIDLRTGAQPADCATADGGTELSHTQLPSDWMAAASGGTKAKAGTWSGTGAADGTAGHFRVKESTDTNCHLQGSVTATGGGGQMELDNVVIASGQGITFNTFTLTAPNA
jgi:hypothetical protein